MTTRERAEKWRQYYVNTGERPPRDTLLFALDRFDAEPTSDGRRFAVDLGCGGGRDTVELLRRGWSVLAIDAQATAIESLLARPDLPTNPSLQTKVARFESATWPRANLINSSFALPLCPPVAFRSMWSRLITSLRVNGRFSGQLFGERDGWVGDPTITFFSRTELDRILAELQVEKFEEEETTSTTPRGTTKCWHLYHIVARKASTAAGTA